VSPLVNDTFGWALALAAALALLGLACADAPVDATRAGGPAVEIVVSPLALPEVTNACYRLSVFNGEGEPVWQRAETCASQFGDAASSVSFVGPCDAAAAANTVRVELEDLWSADGIVPRSTYRNPCGHADNGNHDGGSPCELPFTCHPNEDVQVAFDLTVMRSAHQGFTDIGVTFDDVFCSAKLDTCHGPDYPDDGIFLLHGGEANARQHTAVAAVACAGGSGADVSTSLFFTAFEVTCGAAPNATTYALNLGDVERSGNLVAPNPSLTSGQANLTAAVYYGSEAVADVQTVYTNVAFALPDDGPCSVAWSVVPSASEGAPQPTVEPVYSQVAGVHFAAGESLVSQGRCDRYALDGWGGGVGDGVVTRYFDMPLSYVARLTSGASGFTAIHEAPLWALGDDAAVPADTCAHVLAERPDAEDGRYWIEPLAGDPDHAFEVYCDMTSEGGGWTLVALIDSYDDTHETDAAVETDDFHLLDTKRPYKRSTAEIIAIATHGESLWKLHSYEHMNTPLTTWYEMPAIDTQWQGVEAGAAGVTTRNKQQSFANGWSGWYTTAFTDDWGAVSTWQTPGAHVGTRHYIGAHNQTNLGVKVNREGIVWTNGVLWVR